MKLLIIPIALLFISAFVSAQSMRWNMTVRKGAGDHYTLKAVANLAKGWFVYAEKDSSLGIGSPVIQFQNSTLHAQNLIIQSAAVLIRDTLFNRQSVRVYKDSIILSQDILIGSTSDPDLRLTISGFAAGNGEFRPFEDSLSVTIPGVARKNKINELKLVSIDLSSPVSNCGTVQEDKKHGLIGIFLLGFAGGLIALITPCVFPMIPLTVSFFSNRAGSRKQAVQKSILYSLFIAGIYIVASLPFHFISGIHPEVFNQIATSAWLNILFFIIFIFFALSFFGLFEIRLPAFIANSANNKTNAGNTGGIFFMALTLAVVSFSCTGPILGSLLAGSLSSGARSLSAGMTGFGCSLALPFGLFALFPHWLKALPKSGGWLDTVKKVLAFIELALAFKFLSNADLVAHWGILKREAFIAIWILIAIGLGVYLFGRRPRISLVRSASAVAVFGFAIYLATTMNRSASIISGFAPPMSYSIFKKPDTVIVNDYEKAVALSRKEGKPMLIDFTGWACVNCRKMEENVWTDPAIRDIIHDKYILVSLYVDDRATLPMDQQFYYKEGNKDILTDGDKWATFQAVNFRQVTQPLYVTISPDEKLLNNPVGYTPNISEYKEWLECGIKANYEREK